MLEEWIGANRTVQNGQRRWFTDEKMDLIVWYRGSVVSDFQLCYDKTGDQHAVVWSDRGSLRHHRVDSGNDRPGSPKASPIMAESAEHDGGTLTADFKERAAKIDPALTALVLDKIEALLAQRTDGG
jgi:hypothetical protein